MATQRTIDRGFLANPNLPQEIRTAGGFAQFEDRGLQYVAMLDSVRMRVLRRTATEKFDVTVDNDHQREKGLAMTGCFMDNQTFGGITVWAIFRGTGFRPPAKAGLQQFAGVVIENGVVVSGTAREPEYANLAFGGGAAPSLAIDKGDPSPATGITHAFGALGATILKSVPIPSGRPEHKGLDRRYRDLDAEGVTCGLPYLAISRRARIVLAAVKPHGVNRSMDSVRDAFAAAGFEDVVFLDGGDSAFLNVQGSWVVRMGPLKQQLTTFGTKLFYATPP
jgi:hypothetical protein